MLDRELPSILSVVGRYKLDGTMSNVSGNHEALSFFSGDVLCEEGTLMIDRELPSILSVVGRHKLDGTMSNVSGNHEALSFFSGDVCEEGTLTVILAIVFFSFVFAVHLRLHRATKRRAGLTALTKNHWIEDWFFAPFVPSSLETFIALIFFAWFAMTVSMVFSRFYEGRWSQQFLAQHGILNAIAHRLGCNGLDFEVIRYPKQGPPPEVKGTNSLEYSKDIDFYFGHHVAAGLTWLTLGALQIYLARTGWSVSKRNALGLSRTYGIIFLITDVPFYSPRFRMT
jgi:hypothetical protein